MEDKFKAVIYKMRIWDKNKIKAFFDLAYGEFIIKGFKIVDGNRDIFISFPREKGKDGNWYDAVICNNVFFIKEIEEMALKEYKKLKEA